MINVPNMNKINIFFSEISQQIYKMYEKVAIITQIWQSQMLFYKHEQGIVPDNCTKYEQNHHILLRDNTTNTQNLILKIAIITQILHRAKFYFI